ncbi:MAG: alpha-mannosidase [Paenibacillaceae bacterium]|nr:alpha-mannosidase [Paenibacillaceae bacterium]
MFGTDAKLQARIMELAGYRYREAFTITRLSLRADPEGAIGAYPPEAGDGAAVEPGFRWQGWDEYHWLTATVSIPEQWKGRTVVGLFEIGQTGRNTNSGFEALLFLDGHPYQGVDSNHQEIFFPEDAPGRCLKLDFRIWSGLGGFQNAAVQEHRLQQAAVCWLDEAADDLYYTARAALDTALLLPDGRMERHDLLRILDLAFLRLDWSHPGSEAFYASIGEAQRLLRRELAALPNHHAVTVRCIGHTHIDVAWLWQLKHTREKAARSFSTVLRLMERYPDYVFLQTMPQLYEYIKTDYPEIYEAIKERVKEGRWEAGGAMWLEADCNLSGGEALVRQLLHGIRFFRQEFGVNCEYLWLPDVFGYSWALPQILHQAGIKAFMTTKISWNQYNRMPNDTFMWRGIDGSEILTHFITTPSPNDSLKNGAFYYTYNGAITPASIQGIWEGYRNKDINQELLLAYGYGDGGGGVNREMLEMRRRLNDMPGLPRVTTGRADAYFRELVERMDGVNGSTAGNYKAVWDGELYLELHRGTYTSQAFIKRMNRKLELLYREAEWISVLSALQAGWEAYRQKQLYDGWTIILRNQFHDIIPGSSIRQVYEDARDEYAEAWESGTAILRQGMLMLRGLSEAPYKDGKTFTVYNSASWPRSGLAAIAAGSGMEQGRWQDADGKPLKAQLSPSEDSWLVYVPDLPPMGAAVIFFAPYAENDVREAAGTECRPKAGTETASPSFAAHMENRLLDTPYYTIQWNENGHLTALWDKTAQRHVLAPHEAANVLQVFEDKPKSRHEAWDIDLYYVQKQQTVADLQSAALVELGPLQAAVEFQWSYMESTITQRMTVYADSRRIDFQTIADWKQQRQLLKAAFPVNIRATEATYDIQFGNVKRPTHWNTSWDYARFETVAHQWADLSETGYGVSLLNDSKYGYDIKDNVMRLTLIKAARVPDDTADLAEHVFTYSLLPHSGDWRTGGTVQEAWALNAPLFAAEGAAGHGAPGPASHSSDPFPTFRSSDPGSASHSSDPRQAFRPSAPCSLFRSSSPERVMFDAVKKAEDSDAVILRLHEYAGARGTVTIASDYPVGQWQEVNLLEQPIGDLWTEPEIAFELAPYEIRTFRISLG